LSYQRADIRGTRSTGEKRRLAWPEMLIVLIPFYWAVNVVINALSYLRVLEGSCGHVLLTVQVNAFQWGWRYCYSDTFYTKFFMNPVKVGYKSTISLNGSSKLINRTSQWDYLNRRDVEEVTLIYDIDDEIISRKRYFTNPKNSFIKKWNWNITNNTNNDLTVENYFCRSWLKKFGNIENEYNLKTLNKKWQSGYSVTSQGLDPNSFYFKEYLNPKTNKIIFKLTKDPLRLLRASGALVLPTRSTVRLMSCSDDITHSWAVPGLGLKMDCVPGRIFCIYLNIIREGIYYGQCSELCGWNHYNMPVIVYALPLEHFITWWEIELHSVFNKKYYNYENINSKKTGEYVTYKLLNYKYK
jgi:heme/copper-type cytochrome/quinol oxidase subunit 2